MKNMRINKKDAYLRDFDLIMSSRPGNIEYVDIAKHYECCLAYDVAITKYVHFVFSSRSCL